MLFFRKIRKALLINGAVAKYLMYAAGEILLVVVGILIALQVNNWNERRNLLVLEQGYYQSMREQLLVDRNTLLATIEYNQDKLEKLRKAYGIIAAGDRLKIQELATLSLEFTKYSDFRQRSNIYESLTSSGEIKFIDNKHIVDKLQYLASQYVFIERLEDIHRNVVVDFIAPQLIQVVQFDPLEVRRPDGLFDFPFMNTLYLTIGLMVEKDGEYQNTIKEIEDTISLIENELNE